MVLICRKYGSWSHLKVKLYQLFIEHIKMNNRMMKKKVYFKKKKLKLPMHALLPLKQSPPCCPRKSLFQLSNVKNNNSNDSTKKSDTQISSWYSNHSYKIFYFVVIQLISYKGTLVQWRLSFYT